MDIILDEIIRSADPEYKEFHQRLIPTINKDSVLGLRSPLAQKIAKKYANTDTGERFLDSLPHKYYDENIVHAFMLCSLKCSKENLTKRIVRFLPFIDNWAVCDGLACHLKHFFALKDEMLGFAMSCIDLSVYGDIPTCFLSPSSTTYTIRFGLVCLLTYYIEDKYLENIFAVCKDIGELCGSNPKPTDYSYYVSMAVAWLVSFCLIKEYNRSVSLIEGKSLPKWIHNKSIQKACESYRIDKDKKTYLRSLKK